MAGSVGILAGSMNPSASTSWMSWGFCTGEDGVGERTTGERTTEGMRLCARLFGGRLGLHDAVSQSHTVSGVDAAGGDLSAQDAKTAGGDASAKDAPNTDGAISAGVAALSSAGGLGALVGSQSTPGLTMKLTVSPFWTLYSFNNLASASALPFKRSLWASAGGARGWAAI
jgi:hypothetical protein